MVCAVRVNGVVAESIVDGPGFRYTLFTQGCPHRCPGCHNPETHDFSGGSMMEIDEILAELRQNPLLDGVTFSGGEPFCQADALADLAERVHGMGLSVMSYSGWTLEELSRMGEADPGVARLLKQSDYLVDGRFVLAERDLDLLFRGSRNQRFWKKRDGAFVPYEE